MGEFIGLSSKLLDRRAGDKNLGLLEAFSDDGLRDGCCCTLEEKEEVVGSIDGGNMDVECAFLVKMALE